MEAVCAFVGEPSTEAVLHPNRLGLDTRGGRTEIVSDNSAKWKSELAVADRELFESVAGDLLQALGHETEGRQRVVSAAARFYWKTNHRPGWVAYRLRAKRSWSWLATDWQMRQARRLARRH